MVKISAYKAFLRKSIVLNYLTMPILFIFGGQIANFTRAIIKQNIGMTIW